MGADGTIDIYDRKIFNEIIKLITIIYEFDSLGCFNISSHSIFDRSVYTVYFGE